MPKQPQKKKIPAWLKWLGIIFGSIVLLAVAIALIAWWVFCDLRNSWTKKERVPLPEVIVTKEDAARLQPTYRKVKQAFSGKASSDTTIVLESDDLDKFLAVANEGRQVKEMARFRIEGDKIVVTTDVNLSDIHPLLKGRYLSGDFWWDVKMDDKAWHFHLDSFNVEDRILPSWIINKVNQKIESKEDALRNHYAPEWTHKLKSLTVQDGKITAVISK
ncbi:MAG: hypothetical protein IKZ46_04900 [Victivallales bacterium]|nr:hypothetical protein [Victivallales bacterium]